MHLGEDGVRDKAVVREDDIGAQRLVEDRPTVVGRIVVGQGRAAARLLVVFGEFANSIEGIDPRFRGAQGVGIDVGGVEKRAVEQTFLAEQNGHGIQLFSGAASRDPHLERGIGAQMGQHLLAQGAKVAGVAEHLADLNRQEGEQTRQHFGIVQDPFLQGRQARHAEMAARLNQAALDRRPCVLAEVVMVALVQSLQQQTDLDILDLVRHGGLSGASRRGPGTAACPRPAAWPCSRSPRPPCSAPGRPAWPWRSASAPAESSSADPFSFHASPSGRP